ncbi:MAG: DUF692 domain-containing protein [Pseudomonadota bacterium]
MPSAASAAGAASPVPARAGIGLRAPHYPALLERRPALGFLEVHAENYFGDGGQPLAYLERFRALYPLSLHGVGLSLGSADGLDARHLAQLKALVERFDPCLVSDHLCWCAVDGRHHNDLLPLPYTHEALAVVCGNVARAQDVLGRQILVENLSSYVRFDHAQMPEWEFLGEVAWRTGCGILLDVNNIHVSAVNHGFDPREYLRGVPAGAVRELHLAGFDQGDGLLIDTHGKPVADAVWGLYADAVERFRTVPTLVEWDTDLPALDVLLGEAGKADFIRERMHALAA